jgi:tetratricopeptide (TPR) repeat protein
MRKLFEELQGQLEAFVEQRAHSTLIVPVGTREYVALCATLDRLEQGGSPHVFLTFSEPFEDPVQYSSVVVAAFERKHRELMQVQVPPPPELPSPLHDDRVPAVERLRLLFTFTRSLFAERSDLLLVASLVPREVRDSAAFAKLVDELLQHDMAAPWCSKMRFVVREDGASPALSRSRERRTFARYYTPDLSDDAVVGALENEANDAALPTAERMQSLMILAGMDSSHRRTDGALEKYNLLAQYHLGMGNLPLLALALNGQGEACANAGRPDEARAHFERALTPAVQAKDLPTLISITFNLAQLHQGRSDWARASEFYTSLSTLARASLNPALLVQCFEQLGACARGARSHEEALRQWRSGVTLTEGLGMRDQQLGLLRRMRELVADRGRSGELRELDREIEDLRRVGARELQL